MSEQISIQEPNVEGVRKSLDKYTTNASGQVSLIVDIPLHNKPPVVSRNGKFAFNPDIMTSGSIYSISVNGQTFLLEKIDNRTVRLYEIEG